MNKSNQMIKSVVAIFIVAILIISGVTAYYLYYKEEKVEDKKPIEKVIDDRISPLENQGLVIEVLRIRYIGEWKKLMTPGNSYKEKPSFYFVTDLDELEYSSKNVEHLGKVTKTLFNCLDTMFMENKIVRDAEEEQETSTVSLSIVEQVSVRTGLFKKGTKDIEREKIEVTYDYRTGRWTGDDSFRDYDGYGHYVGSTFEVWFNIYQMDNDRDYIPYWTEVNVLGTDPLRDDSNKDPDGDGIPTYWEWRWGYDPNVWDDHEKLDPDIDGLENIEEYKTSQWLSDPFHQDIYIEVDYMGAGPKGTFLLSKDKPHVYWEEGAQALTDKFSEHNINVYFDMGWPDTPDNGGGDVLPHYTGFSQDSGMILQFYQHYFPNERKGIFRYVVMSHGGPFNHPSKGNIYDCINIGYTISLKGYITRIFTNQEPPTMRATIKHESCKLMHELGHSIGIHPWTFEGCDNLSYAEGKNAAKEYDATWGNYQSVMNYRVMYKMDVFDYSDGDDPAPGDQNDWLKLFIPTFEYNDVLIEETFFKPPGFDKIVYGETEEGVTGYTYDENLTIQFEKTIGDWSPVEPIKANWKVFKLIDKNEHPNYSDVVILVQPKDVPFAGWAEYTTGNLDSQGKIIFYSQQEIVNTLLEQIKK